MADVSVKLRTLEGGVPKERDPAAVLAGALPKAAVVAPFTGGVAQTAQDALFAEVHASAFGVKAFVAESQTDKLRRAIAWCETYGATLKLPYGPIALGAPQNDTEAVLRISKLMNFNCSRGTRLMPDATVGSRHILLVKPAVNDGVSARGISIRGVQIGQLGIARNGGDGIRIDTTNKNGFVADLLVENCCVADGGLGKYGFQHVNVYTADGNGNTLTGNPTGGMFHATIRNNSFFGGIKCVQTGDSNNIIENIISGSNEGIYYDAIAGAATHRIIGNNITATGDTLYLKGQQIHVIRNQLEAVGTYTGSQALPAVITADGASTVGIVIEGNNINCYTRADAVAAINGARVRVAPNTVTYAVDHFLYRAVNSPGGTVERQLSETAGALGSVLGKSLVSLDAASWTMGVWQKMTLLNGWTEGSDANYRNGLWWMPLRDGTVRLAGIVLYNATNPTLPIANFPATFRISGKAQRLMALGNNNGVYGPYVIVVDLAGNISGEGVKPNAFYQFDNSSFSIRPQ